MLEFNEILKQLRKDKNITQKQIADYLEITDRAYQHYEYGKREPDIKTLKKICEFYDVSADYLLGISETRTRQP